MLRPSNGLSFFPFEPLSNAADQQLVDALVIIYGARDIFIGVAIYAASFFGSKKTMGVLLMALGATAFVDGEVVRRWGGEGGEWNHWGYAPVVSVVGGLLMGVLDGLF
jgi:hypothetical protein